jgi:hypothetical protein
LTMANHLNLPYDIYEMYMDQTDIEVIALFKRMTDFIESV